MRKIAFLSAFGLSIFGGLSATDANLKNNNQAQAQNEWSADYNPFHDPKIDPESLLPNLFPIIATDHPKILDVMVRRYPDMLKLALNRYPEMLRQVAANHPEVLRNLLGERPDPKSLIFEVDITNNAFSFLGSPIISFLIADRFGVNRLRNLWEEFSHFIPYLYYYSCLRDSLKDPLSKFIPSLADQRSYLNAPEMEALGALWDSFYSEERDLIRSLKIVQNNPFFNDITYLSGFPLCHFLVLCHYTNITGPDNYDESADELNGFIESFVFGLVNYCGGNINKTDSFGNTLLHLVQILGYHGLVSSLIYDINTLDCYAKNKQGKTPMELYTGPGMEPITYFLKNIPSVTKAEEFLEYFSCLGEMRYALASRLPCLVHQAWGGGEDWWKNQAPYFVEFYSLFIAQSDAKNEFWNFLFKSGLPLDYIINVMKQCGVSNIVEEEEDAENQRDYRDLSTSNVLDETLYRFVAFQDIMGEKEREELEQFIVQLKREFNFFPTEYALVKLAALLHENYFECLCQGVSRKSIKFAEALARLAGESYLSKDSSIERLKRNLMNFTTLEEVEECVRMINEKYPEDGSSYSVYGMLQNLQIIFKAEKKITDGNLTALKSFVQSNQTAFDRESVDYLWSSAQTNYEDNRNKYESDQKRQDRVNKDNLAKIDYLEELISNF